MEKFKKVGVVGRMHCEEFIAIINSPFQPAGLSGLHTSLTTDN